MASPTPSSDASDRERVRLEQASWREWTDTIEFARPVALFKLEAWQIGLMRKAFMAGWLAGYGYGQLD